MTNTAKICPTGPQTQAVRPSDDKEANSLLVKTVYLKEKLKIQCTCNVAN